MADGVGPEMTVRPLTAELWDDAITVFGTRGDPASCWCQFFTLSSQDWRSSTRERNRERLRAQCDQAVDDSRLWSVTCFVVRVGFRRQGMAAALLEAAVDFAAAHGAAVVEGYPVDVGERGSIPASELYHGAASTFAACGFEEVGRSSARRPVMRRLV
jgi:GNAT superfamily N-acetyltransferase